MLHPEASRVGHMWGETVLKIEILAGGKCKEAYFEDACREYEKRLQAYCAITTRRYPEGKVPCPSDGFFVVALALEGRELSSQELAMQLSEWMNRGISRISFLIGDSDGLPKEIIAQADDRLSLSQMTWPHSLALVMLEEQLYRALNINAGGKYHK
jgi:23S rRNA (pseudouridine1915-N3)-methyltransferase